jgi:hypothetical protein
MIVLQHQTFRQFKQSDSKLFSILSIQSNRVFEARLAPFADFVFRHIENDNENNSTYEYSVEDKNESLHNLYALKIYKCNN